MSVSLKPLKDITSIDRGILSDIEERYHQIEEEKVRMAESFKAQIATVGIYNAGKSTLLNALIDKKIFEIGDVPTTKELDRYEMENIVYVDTPGLNANDEDNRTAYEGYRQSDILLFVSNIQGGGINSAEAGYLKMLKEIIGDEQLLRKNTVFVLTNKDQLEEKDSERVLEKYKENIRDILGIEVDIYACDSTSYETGKKENTPTLVEQSGIEDVRRKIEQILERKVDSARRERLNLKIDEFQKILLEIKQKLEERIKEIETSKLSTEQRKAEIINLRKEFEEKKNEMIEEIKKHQQKRYDSDNLYFIESLSSIWNYKSEYDLKKEMRSQVKKIYDKRDAIAKKSASFKSELYKTYLNYYDDPQNFYYKNVMHANQLVIDYVKALKKLSIVFTPRILEQIEYTLPDEAGKILNNMEYRLLDDVVQTGKYYSLDWYVDRVNIKKYDTGDKGLFGFTKYEYAAPNMYEAIDEIKKDMSDVFDRNCKYVWRDIGDVIINFANNMEKQLNEKQQLIDEIVSNMSHLDNNIEKDELKNAIHMIDEMIQ